MILTHAVADWLLSSGVISESDIDGPADAAEGQIVLTGGASEEFENGVRVGMLLQLLWSDGAAHPDEALDTLKELHTPVAKLHNWNALLPRLKARGAEVPESFYHDPLMYQGGSDTFLPPRADIPLKDTSWGCDMEGEIAVVTDDVPMGVSKEDAAGHIKLVMLVNDVSLRGLIPGELAKGFGFFQSKPASAFSPVAVTPDELGDAWQGSVIHLPLMVDYNGQPFGRANAGVDATFSLAELVAHAAKTRDLGAGTIIGSGTVSNQGPDGDPGKPVAEGGLGYSCIAEIRMIETIADGEAKTRFMEPGDTVRVEMKDKDGHSIFGAIEQKVVEA